MDVPIEIDDELLEETKRLLGESDSKEAVKRVLERYCEARRKYQDLLDIAGTVEFYEGYDPKKLRFSRYDPDTSILVDVLRGGNIENAELLLMLVGTEEMAFARFTELEVLMGARDKRDWDSIRAFFKKRVLLDPQPETWSKASRIYFDLRRNGRTLRSSADCCIAQIALEHDLVLVHNDRDFEPVAEVVPLRLLRLKLRPANQKKNLP